jgi:nitrate reductase cytochrome c-type subunit
MASDDTWPARRRTALLLLIAVGLATPAAVWTAGHYRVSGADPAQPRPKAPPQNLFATWPQGRKPEAVIVLSGQRYGYIQPCGCSADQAGGLERLANFLDLLRGKGWPVVPLDLGDLPSDKAMQRQAVLKYGFTMRALREMGYAAVALGKKEFGLSADHLLTQYSLQPGNERPRVLAANLVGVTADKQPIPLAQRFPNGQPNGSTVGEWELVAGDPKQPAVGVVGVVGSIGPSTGTGIQKIDPGFDLQPNAKVLADALKAMAAAKTPPAVRVLMYQGTPDEAKQLAAAFPQFDVIQCDDPGEAEAPSAPEMVGKTLVVRVGHKGQSVGVVGAFKAGNGYEFHYQLVRLSEEFATPPEKVKDHKILKLLEEYQGEVKREDLLGEYVRSMRSPHAVQQEFANLKPSFVGSEKCMGCHAAEYKVWADSGHGHAMDALEKIAKNPGQRNFDPECVVCHTVGLAHPTGYENALKTPALKHVGCENCHGPGSLHVAQPNNAQFFKALSPWKVNPTDRLPTAEVMKEIAAAKLVDRNAVEAKLIPNAAQKNLLQQVNNLCMKCHDQDNDPHYEIMKYWPKVAHTGMKGQPAGGGGALFPTKK